MTHLKQSVSLITLGLAGALALAACGKKEETPPPAATTPPATTTPPPSTAMTPAQGVTVASVDLGTAVGPDQKVTSPTTTFSPKDTIYAAVSTTGAASNATLGAKWTYQDGQIVNQSAQTIAPTGPAATAFQISKPDGWPVGKYKVEITKDGVSAGSRDFEVK